MEEEKRPILQFAPFQSAVDEGFWHLFSSLKLNQLGIDDSPLPISGFYAPCSHPQVSNHLTLLSESLPSESSEDSVSSRGNRNRCSVPGTLYNTNTLEAYKGLDKQALLKAEAKKIWDDIHSGKAVEDSALLSRFLLVSYADLKKWSFLYWFAFPALVLEPAATLNNIKPASECFSTKEAESLSAACNEWRQSSVTADVPFFFVRVRSDASVCIRPLKDWDLSQNDCQQLFFGFYDPCRLPNNPGWPLRNFLALIAARWNIKKVRFFCYREHRGFADLGLCLVGEALVSVPAGWRDREFMPNAVGWELNRGNRGSRLISLAKTMDPIRLAVSAADLNLKLMRWRALPSLDLDTLFSTKCLLLGAGKLGCQVSRMLLAWGVRKITLVDNGRVAMSNPLRQSLYTLDDCLNGGEYKAVAAVKSLKQIFPAVEAEAVVMTIPTPGHPISAQEEESVLNDCRRLHDLIESYDFVFLLTDTRESRWLPTIFCATSDKITITAALGFDSFLVMRHGAGPFSLSNNLSNLSLSETSGRQRLGCYFCNDVVAPIDSTANCTLDQQCTVTRPGLAPVASALAVELLVGILHHPNRAYAEAEHANAGSGERPLGILPHQIRGSFRQFSQITLAGHCSKSCTACSETVMTEYRNRGMEFVLQAINHPTYLEDLNLKLMRQGALPSLDLDTLFSTKCLLLGAGTLGCQVSRMLLDWGVRKITLVDNGRVAMSNPLRQSLYTLDDCLNGGEYKAVAAVKSLKQIFPAVEAEAVVMSIPMPGHPISTQEEESVLNDCRRLHDLIESHDVVFLLTDTRESRWLPTIFCASSDKITITSALGFDSFLVMRHGAGPFSLSNNMSNLSLSENSGRQRLGCYFCNDVVAPIDSTANRTLDQQCTVTRPGLAPIASGLAVELLVGILHHPNRTYAEAEHANAGSGERPLGILPHQIRGSLPQFSQITLLGHCSKSCTACSETVVTEYRSRGMEFVLQAINHPTYLEDLTGLTELMKSASAFNLDWENDGDTLD